MEAKHTPGPWVAVFVPDLDETLIGTEDRCVALAIMRSWDGQPSEAAQEANAALIAAAPALLEALKEAEAFVSRANQDLIESCSLDGTADTLDAGVCEEVADNEALLARIAAALHHAGGE